MCVCVGHKNTNVPLILKVQIFFVGGKTCSETFLGILQGRLDPFDLKIALCYLRTISGSKGLSLFQKSIEMPHYIVCLRTKNDLLWRAGYTPADRQTSWGVLHHTAQYLSSACI
jgi:hypothetical protein